MRDKQRAAIRAALKRSLERSPLLSISLQPKHAPVTCVGAVEGSAIAEPRARAELHPKHRKVWGSCPPTPQNNELPMGLEALGEQQCHCTAWHGVPELPFPSYSCSDELYWGLWACPWYWNETTLSLSGSCFESINSLCWAVKHCSRMAWLLKGRHMHREMWSHGPPPVIAWGTQKADNFSVCLPTDKTVF